MGAVDIAKASIYKARRSKALTRLDSFIDGAAGKRLTYKGLTQ
jgi:hypothetical protein